MALFCPSPVKLHRTSSEWLRLGPPLLYLLFFLCASHAFAELALCCRAGTCWHCLFTLEKSSSNSLAHKIQVHILESTWKQMLFYTRNNCWNSTQSKRMPEEGSSLYSRLLLGHQTFPPTILCCPAVLAKGIQGWSWWSLKASFLSSLCLCWSLELCHHQPPEHRCWRVDDVSGFFFFIFLLGGRCC